MPFTILGVRGTDKRDGRKISPVNSPAPYPPLPHYLPLRVSEMNVQIIESDCKEKLRAERIRPQFKTINGPQQLFLSGSF